MNFVLMLKCVNVKMMSFLLLYLIDCNYH